MSDEAGKVTRDEAIASFKEDPEHGTILTICQGSPFCQLQGRAAEVVQQCGSCGLCQVEVYDGEAEEWIVVRGRELLQ